MTGVKHPTKRTATGGEEGIQSENESRIRVLIQYIGHYMEPLHVDIIFDTPLKGVPKLCQSKGDMNCSTYWLSLKLILAHFHIELACTYASTIATTSSKLKKLFGTPHYPLALNV